MASPTSVNGADLEPSLIAMSRADKKKTIGFLVSYDKDDKGEFIELSEGRWLLTSSPNDHVDYMLLNDQSIGALHAIIHVTDKGKVSVLDQLSDEGTWHVPSEQGDERKCQGELVKVSHGDKFRFGGREFTFCLVP